MLDDSQDPKLPEPPDQPTGEPKFSTNRLGGEDERDLLVPKKMQPVSPNENPGDFSDSGIKTAGDEQVPSAGNGPEINQPQDEEEIGPARLGTGSLVQRLTGTLRRVTGPLGATDSLPPKQPQSIPPTEKRRVIPPVQSGETAHPAELQKPAPGKPAEPGVTQPLDEEEIGPARIGTGSLVQRLTGTLRRVTGPLGATDSLPPKQPQTIPPTEKRRDVPVQKVETASLPELQGPEPGAPAEPGINPSQDEEEIGPASLGTGSLIQRLTGTLRRVTGPLSPTDALPPKAPQSAPPEKRRATPVQKIQTASLPELKEPVPGPQASADTSQPPAGEEMDVSSLGTGSLIQRLTGTLRRVTGPLHPTGGVPAQRSEPESGTTEQPPQSRPPAPETTWSRKNEPLLTGPLVEETDNEVLFSQEQQPIPLPESRRQVPDSGIVTGRLEGLDEDLTIGTESQPVPIPEGDRPIVPVDRGAVPPSSEISETHKPEAPLPRRKQPAGPDYISEIRNTLTSEEPERPKRWTGSLIQRFTGTLRRITSPLRPADSTPLEETKLPQETVQSELADDFLNDRLGGVQVDEPAAGEPAIIDESGPIQLPSNWGELPDSGIEAGELLEMEEGKLGGREIAPDIPLGKDDAIDLLESGTIAALGRAEEASQQEEEPDWWAEIRKEAAQSAAEAAEKTEELPAASVTDEQGDNFDFRTGPDQGIEAQPPQRGSSGQLRSFITGILGRSGEKSKQQPEENEFSDEMMTGRLSRSLGTEAEQVPDLRAEELFAGEETFPTAETDQLSGFETGEAEETPSPASEADIVFGTVEEEPPLLEGLEVSFSFIDEAANQAAPDEEFTTTDLYPEDEQLLWGDTSTNAGSTYEFNADNKAGAATETPVSPNDIWGSSQTGAYGYGADLRQEIWGEELKPEVPEETVSSEPGEYVASDEYAAEYLSGEETPSEGEEEALSQAGEDKEMSAQDLRSIALEDYEEGEFDYSAYKTTIDWGDEKETAVVEPDAAEEEAATAEAEPQGKAEVEPEAEEESALAGDWRTWLAARNTSQKLLLAEGALVVLAMLVAVPFFIFMIIRGPVKPAAQLMPNGLPAGVPIPTGLTLPGGWYFPLEKSTIADGKWQPDTSEWLEGTEVRRVIALPWNPQTEAVIKTFQPGNPVELTLSDNSTLNFKVSSVERVPVGNNQIYYDTRPSLVIILYKEKDTSRWVIICKP